MEDSSEQHLSTGLHTDALQRNRRSGERTDDWWLRTGTRFMSKSRMAPGLQVGSPRTLQMLVSFPLSGFTMGTSWAPHGSCLSVLLSGTLGLEGLGSILTSWRGHLGLIS
jgi:hypothetical protein